MDHDVVSVAPQLSKATPKHLAQLYSWFDSEASISSWGGPGFRYPMSDEAFADAVQLDRPSYVWLGAKGELLAFGQFYLRVNRHHLGRLAVSPAQIGKGLGSRFIKVLIATAKATQKGSGVSLFVHENNRAARRCYENLGFTYQTYPESLPEAFTNCLYMVQSEQG